MARLALFHRAAVETVGFVKRSADQVLQQGYLQADQLLVQEPTLSFGLLI